MKCWRIELYDHIREHLAPGLGDFVWEETRGKARRAGVGMLGATDFHNVRAIRVPTLDGDDRILTDDEIIGAGYAPAVRKERANA